MNMRAQSALAAIVLSSAVLGSAGTAFADRRTTYLYNDLLGTPVAATDASGTVLWRKAYGAFGEEEQVEAFSVVDTVGDDRGFTGHTYDRESQLVYMGARFYNPRLAVFYSTDPADVVPGNPMSFNRYIYANQNPMRYVDPDGELPVLIPLAILAYRAYSAYDTAKQVHDTVQMLRDPQVTPQDLAVAAAGAIAGAIAGKAGGALIKLAAPLAKRAIGGVARRAAPTAKRVISKVTGKCCFVEGTLVSTANGMVRIEDLSVGDRVETISGESSVVSAEMWIVRARLTKSSEPENPYLVELLRSRAWLEAQGIEGTGYEFRLELTELDVEGLAVVEAIRPVRVEPGEGRLVVMTVTHLSNDVFELRFVEGGDGLRGTGSHPLYSVDRDTWVLVRDLQVGERLQTAEGAVTVAALERVRGVDRVYNLEVEGDHEYFVDEPQVRAHNACPGGTVIIEHSSERAARRAALREAGIPAGTPPSRAVPAHAGSRAPSGPPGERLEWDPVSDQRIGAHYDKYGHSFPDGTSIPPHYGVDIPGKATRHHTFPTSHDPTKNR